MRPRCASEPGSTGLAQSTSRRSRARVSAPPDWWRGSSTVKSRPHTAGRERPVASSWHRRFAASAASSRDILAARASRRRAATRSSGCSRQAHLSEKRRSAAPCRRRRHGPAFRRARPQFLESPGVALGPVAPPPPDRSIPPATGKPCRVTSKLTGIDRIVPSAASAHSCVHCAPTSCQRCASSDHSLYRLARQLSCHLSRHRSDGRQPGLRAFGRCSSASAFEPAMHDGDQSDADADQRQLLHRRRRRRMPVQSWGSGPPRATYSRLAGCDREHGRQHMLHRGRARRNRQGRPARSRPPVARVVGETRAGVRTRSATAPRSRRPAAGSHARRWPAPLPYPARSRSGTRRRSRCRRRNCATLLPITIISPETTAVAAVRVRRAGGVARRRRAPPRRGDCCRQRTSFSSRKEQQQAGEHGRHHAPGRPMLERVRTAIPETRAPSSAPTAKLTSGYPARVQRQGASGGEDRQARLRRDRRRRSRKVERALSSPDALYESARFGFQPGASQISVAILAARSGPPRRYEWKLVAFGVNVQRPPPLIAGRRRRHGRVHSRASP